jgi:hypothetical protein
VALLRRGHGIQTSKMRGKISSRPCEASFASGHVGDAHLIIAALVQAKNRVVPRVVGSSTPQAQMADMQPEALMLQPRQKQPSRITRQQRRDLNPLPACNPSPRMDEWCAPGARRRPNLLPCHTLPHRGESQSLGDKHQKEDPCTHRSRHGDQNHSRFPLGLRGKFSKNKGELSSLQTDLSMTSRPRVRFSKRRFLKTLVS